MSLFPVNDCCSMRTVTDIVTGSACCVMLVFGHGDEITWREDLL